MAEKDRSSAQVRLFEQRSRAKWALASHGPDSLPFAVQMLLSPDQEEREDGQMIVGLIGGDDDAIEKMVGLLQSTADPQIRHLLIAMLGERHNGRAIPYLTALLMDPRAGQETKQAATNALRILTPSGEPDRDAASDVRVEMGDWIAEHRGLHTISDDDREHATQGYGSAAV